MIVTISNMLSCVTVVNRPVWVANNPSTFLQICVSHFVNFTEKIIFFPKKSIGSLATYVR